MRKVVMKKKFIASLASLGVLLGALVFFNVMSTNSDAASLPRDCDNNSIIYCGATTPDELKKFYKENKTGDLPTLYNHYGISSDMINSVSGANLGEVHKDGRITLGGKTVATGAKSIGRKDVYKPSTTVKIGGKTYYEHAPKDTFGVESIKAWVFLDKNGKFIGAILTSCGNPVRGNPTPVPEYACDALAASKISREEYQFNAKASAKNGATITGYSFDFGDGKTQNSTSASVKHTYAKAGTYTAKVTVNVKVDGKTKTVTSAKCQVKVTVENPPAAPEYKCDALAARLIKEADRSYAYDLSYTVKNGATLKTVDFDFGDGKTKKDVAPADLKNVTHSYEKAGSYKTIATLHFNVNGAVKDVKCETSITISPEMCPLNPSLPKDDEGCKPCPVPGKEQYPVGSPECKENCPVPGKEDLPKDSPDCVEDKEHCDVPGKEHLPKDSPDCKETPVTPETPQTPETPAELPKTGASDFILGGLGLSSLAAAGYYWIASRRSLVDTMLNR